MKIALILFLLLCISFGFFLLYVGIKELRRRSSLSPDERALEEAARRAAAQQKEQEREQRRRAEQDAPLTRADMNSLKWFLFFQNMSNRHHK